jgi:hypothetical protein
MGEIRTVTTLRRKQAKIEAAIRNYEAALKRARLDLAHVAATITILETPASAGAVSPYADIKRLWGRGELLRLCRGFLEAEGPLTALQLAERAMAATGLDPADRVLVRSVHLKLVHAQRQQHLRGNLADAGRLRGSRVWALKPIASEPRN